MNENTRSAANRSSVARSRAAGATSTGSDARGAANTCAAERLAARLSELSLLEANWDGYGAEPLSREILAAAAEFARWLSGSSSPCGESPTITPMTGGRVQFEWHRGQRSLELEFESPTEIHYLQWDSETGVENEDVIPAADREALGALIRWFAEN